MAQRYKTVLLLVALIILLIAFGYIYKDKLFISIDSTSSTELTEELSKNSKLSSQGNTEVDNQTSISSNRSITVLPESNLNTYQFIKDSSGKVIDIRKIHNSIKSVGIEPYVLEIDYQSKISYDKKVSLPYIEKSDLSGMSYISIGRIKNGEIEGKELFMVLSEGEIGGILFMNSYLISLGDGVYLGFRESDNTFSIKSHNYPLQVTFPSTGHILKKENPEIINEVNNEVNIAGSFYYSGVKFLVLNNECVVVEMPDGRYMKYRFQYPIIGTTDINILDFNLNNGKKNKESYSYGMPMCGFSCGGSTIADEIIDGNINSNVYKIVGKTSDNRNVYTYTDSNNDVYQKMYNNKNTAAYIDMTDGYENLESSKYSYKEFADFYPVLFWQEPLGNWIRFTNTRFSLLAEKCKPVIYLYPKKKTILNVQVTPNGGFTKTIPEYVSSGWNIEADTDSTIRDLLTDNIYPYLYWSGIGIDYPIDENLGWMVKKENIEKFLDEKLILLGLNQKEIFDFKDYWVEKLSDREYYQIYFLTKEQIDAMDPLKISPVKPDNIIRVMLTAKGFDRPVPLKEQVLPPTSKREGFTVVEWGGVLLR